MPTLMEITHFKSIEKSVSRQNKQKGENVSLK